MKKVSYQRLVAYAAGDLSPAEVAEVEAWLAGHPEARDTVGRYRVAAALRQADDAVDPPAEVADQARTIGARDRVAPRGSRFGEAIVHGLVEMIFDSRAEPAIAGLRGATTSFQLTYQLSGPAGVEGELDLQAEPAEDGPTQPGGRPWRIRGQIASPDPLGDFEVDVCRAGSLSPIHTVSGRDRGVFAVSLEAGTYDLHLRLAAGVVVIPDIRVV